MEFSRQEYWSGLPFPSSGVLPDPGIEPGSSALPADSLPSEPPDHVNILYLDNVKRVQLKNLGREVEEYNKATF